MLYEDIKKSAIEYGKSINVNIDKVSELPNAYVFESSAVECTGFVPFAVDKKTGSIKGLWSYLQGKNYTMDDMKEIQF